MVDLVTNWLTIIKWLWLTLVVDNAWFGWRQIMSKVTHPLWIQAVVPLRGRFQRELGYPVTMISVLSQLRWSKNLVLSLPGSPQNVQISHHGFCQPLYCQPSHFFMLSNENVRTQPCLGVSPMVWDPNSHTATLQRGTGVSSSSSFPSVMYCGCEQSCLGVRPIATNGWIDPALSGFSYATRVCNSTGHYCCQVWISVVLHTTCVLSIINLKICEHIWKSGGSDEYRLLPSQSACFCNV